MSEASRYTTAERHEATHTLDELSTDMVRILQKMIAPSYVVGAQDKMRAVMDALQAFRDRVTEVHTATVREMQN